MFSRRALAGFLFLIGSQVAHAECFDFINDVGPSQIGNVALGANTKTICVRNVYGSGGASTLVELSDQQGALAILGVSKTTNGRCPGYCKTLEISWGHSHGVNIEARGITLTFQVEPNTASGKSDGTLMITESNGVSTNFLVQKQ